MRSSRRYSSGCNFRNKAQVVWTQLVWVESLMSPTDHLGFSEVELVQMMVDDGGWWLLLIEMGQWLEQDQAINDLMPAQK
ncbi:hypothetical protein VULLAG_LOCUS17493 [Vulpes lagopus]